MARRSLVPLSALVTGVLLSLSLTGPAWADRDRRDNGRYYQHDDRGRHDNRRYGYDRHRGGSRTVVIQRHRYPAPPPSWHGSRYGYHQPYRYRTYRNVVIVRPYGHFYHGYGWYRTDADAYRWLAFTAITLKTLDVMSEAQERAHEAAQIRAASAPIGQSVVWSDGSASGSVVALRDGTSSAGRYCREFQQTVTVGGRSEQAYGTACQAPDGSWQIVDGMN